MKISKLSDKQHDYLDDILNIVGWKNNKAVYHNTELKCMTTKVTELELGDRLAIFVTRGIGDIEVEVKVEQILPNAYIVEDERGNVYILEKDRYEVYYKIVDDAL